MWENPTHRVVGVSDRGKNCIFLVEEEDGIVVVVVVVGRG